MQTASTGGWYTTSGGIRGRYDPLANPPEDFELKPQDFDIDAELIPSDLDQSTGFVLKAKDEEGTSCYQLPSTYLLNLQEYVIQIREGDTSQIPIFSVERSVSIKLKPGFF